MSKKKSKWLAIVLALAMVLSLVPAMGMADNNNDVECEPCECETCAEKVLDLIAGQNKVVGEVTVINDDEKVCVTYALDEDALEEGWLIYETHLAIATEKEGIPQTPENRWGTNPIPGLFPYGDDELDGVEYHNECILFEDVDFGICDEVYIAAHAVVKRVVEEAYCETIEEAGDDFFVSDTETMVVESSNFDTPFNAELAWVHPSWNTSLSRPFDEDAEWIWESEYVVNPVDGDVVTFEKEFEVPGIPKDGTLFITADNGFAVYLNGEFLYNSPSLLQYSDLGDLKAAYVDRTGWQTVREVDLTDELVKGDNILTIIGVNEYQGPDDGFSDGTVTSNPGGVIFEFDVDWDAVVECYPDVWEDETAWGDGDRFNERGNWGMYFKYKICEPDPEPWIIYGIEFEGNALYEINIEDEMVAENLLFATPRNNNNGLAFDRENQRLYYAAGSALYFYDLENGDEMSAGSFPSGHVVYGACFGMGSYWYINNQTDDLYRVDFDDDGKIVTIDETTHMNIAGGKEFGLGDIAMDKAETGIIYGSTSATYDDTEFFTYNVVTQEYEMITDQSDDDAAVNLQIAFGLDGVLYGTVTRQSTWYVVDTEQGTKDLFYTGVKQFSDLARGQYQE